MKRIALLLLVLVLLLSACSLKKETPAKPAAPVQDSTVTDTDNQQQEDQPAPVVYRNPLNGEVVSEPWTGRATAVVINNLRDALPHYGTSQADFLYEFETESGITRMLAIYNDVSTMGQIGPVRSDRTFFNSIAVSYDAVIAHCGGSVRGRNAGYEDSSNKIENWAHLDATYYEGVYFYRDNDRYQNQGYNWEHCLFTDGTKLQKGLEKLGIAAPTDRSSDFGLTFQEDVTLNGAVANTVTITFQDGKTTTFTYDAEAGVYNTSQYGSEYRDANNGEIVKFRNVMILYSEQWKRSDGEYPRSYYNLIGEGEGLLAIDGKVVKIKWARESLYSPYTYTLLDGTPITLGTGHTYVGFTPVTEPSYS